MFLVAVFQVFVNRGSVLQVVTDRCIDIRERERGVLLENFLSGRSLIESVHDGIQTDAGSSYADDSVFVSRQRRWISRNLQGHGCILSRGLRASLPAFLDRIFG